MATSYGTTIEADAYFEDRGVTSWLERSEDEKSGALIRASAYIDGRYRARFPGRKAGGRTQEREWPRTGATDASGDAIADNEVPAEIVRSTFEAAFRDIAAPGSLLPDFHAGQVVASKRVKAGPVETETKFGTAGSSAAARPVFGVIEDLLAGLLVSEPSRTVTTSFLTRA